jgi:hypothetical protein
MKKGKSIVRKQQEEAFDYRGDSENGAFEYRST